MRIIATKNMTQDISLFQDLLDDKREYYKSKSEKKIASYYKSKNNHNAYSLNNSSYINTNVSINNSSTIYKDKVENLKYFLNNNSNNNKNNRVLKINNNSCFNNLNTNLLNKIKPTNKSLNFNDHTVLVHNNSKGKINTNNIAKNYKHIDSPLIRTNSPSIDNVFIKTQNNSVCSNSIYNDDVKEDYETTSLIEEYGKRKLVQMNSIITSKKSNIIKNHLLHNKNSTMFSKQEKTKDIKQCSIKANKIKIPKLFMDKYYNKSSSNNITQFNLINEDKKSNKHSNNSYNYYSDYYNINTTNNETKYNDYYNNRLPSLDNLINKNDKERLINEYMTSHIDKNNKIKYPECYLRKENKNLIEEISRFHSLLKKQIKPENKNIVNFIKRNNSNISPLFIKKVNKMNDFDMNNFDRICIKQLTIQDKDIVLSKKIREKIKVQKKLESLNFKIELDKLNDILEQEAKEVDKNRIVDYGKLRFEAIHRDLVSEWDRMKLNRYTISSLRKDE